MDREFVIIHGTAPAHLLGKGDESDHLVRVYVSEIVYGTPRRIFATLLATGKFVALVEYDRHDRLSGGPAYSTFERMPSFSYGASFSGRVEDAFQSFGSWVAHYSGCLAGEAAPVFTEAVSSGRETWKASGDFDREAARTKAFGVAPGESRRIDLDA